MPEKKVNLDNCIACTTCVVACPVAAATPNFLGPRMIGPAYERFRLQGLSEDSSLHYCSNCKNCDIACPHGVPITKINMLARAKVSEKRLFPLRDWVLGHGEVLAKLLKYIPAFLKNFGMLNPLTRVVLDIIGVERNAPLPAFAKKYFKSYFKTFEQPKYDKAIVFFPGCYIDTYDHDTGINIMRMINKAGYNVIVPDEFCCCGVPLVSNGFFEGARKNAEINLKTVAKYKSQGVTIVTGCPSCALMFKTDIPEYYPELLGDDYDGAMIDVSEFLLQAYQSNKLKLPTPKNAEQTKVIYHAPCHLRAQSGQLYGYELMKSVNSLAVENADAGCCGISGSYGFKKEKYKIGMKVGDKLFKAISGSGADLSASECGTCRVQMQHGAKLKAVHPLSVILKEYDK